jgi:hypothetical protein
MLFRYMSPPFIGQPDNDTILRSYGLRQALTFPLTLPSPARGEDFGGTPPHPYPFPLEGRGVL